MAEEKDAGELEAEKGTELGALPPIPVQLPTSSGETRLTQREPGSWLQEHGVQPPPGSFPGLNLSFSGRTPARSTTAPAKRVVKKTAPKKVASRRGATG